MDADTFECIRCGKVVYHAASYCPHCGLELYPEGEDEESEGEVSDAELQPAQRRFPPFVAVTIGGIIGLFVTAISWVGLSQIPACSDTMLPASCLIGGFAAGYLSTSLAFRMTVRSLVLYGLLNALLAVLMTSSGRHISTPNYLLIALALSFVVCILSVYAGERAYRFLFRRAYAQNSPTAREDDLYLELLQRLDFDHARVQCMLEHERTEASTADRCTLLRRAIERWERDNQ